ncbi:MAG TPA: hypothetical protein VJ463_03655 [Geothrix sp.]|nr:hypothetical protein [Geothrix sp.]
MSHALSFRKESIQQSSSASASLIQPGAGHTGVPSPRGTHDYRQPSTTTITETFTYTSN